jgi:hypothetical protein
VGRQAARGSKLAHLRRPLVAGVVECEDLFVRGGVQHHLVVLARDGDAAALRRLGVVEVRPHAAVNLHAVVARVHRGIAVGLWWSRSPPRSVKWAAMRSTKFKF